MNASARGRDRFARIRPLLAVCETVLRWCPRPVAATLMTLCRYVPMSPGLAARYLLLRRLSASCGECVLIGEGVHLLHLSSLEIGDYVSIHPMSYIDAAGGVRIGSDVSIAHNCSILSAEHDYSDPSMAIRDAPIRRCPTTIGSDVWLGAGVRVLGGVEIGSRSVVGAGAVVSRDVPSLTVAVGVPARPKLTIPAADDVAVVPMTRVDQPSPTGDRNSQRAA